VRYSINPLFFQAEYDLINAPSYGGPSGTDIIRSNYSRLLFGIGYAFPLGRRGAMNALAMYDVLYKVPSVFSSPYVIRIYFTF